MQICGTKLYSLFIGHDGLNLHKRFTSNATRFFGPNSYMAKVFTIPVVPRANRRRRITVGDNRYVEGQRMIVEAMKYLAQTDPQGNRAAVEFLSEHFRTRFRMSDSPMA